jgi:acylphosphatase
MEVVQRGFRVTGRVQGVFFRAWTRDVACGLGLRGTVRNLPDGSVEAHAAGSPQALEAFEECLWQGPPSARVETVQTLESTRPLPAGPFQVLR